MLARAEKLASGLDDAADHDLQLPSLPPFHKHVDVLPFLNNSTNLVNAEVCLMPTASPQEVDDVDSELDEIDMVDPAAVAVSDYDDMLAVADIEGIDFSGSDTSILYKSCFHVRAATT